MRIAVQSVPQNVGNVRMVTISWMADARLVRILVVKAACTKWTCATSAKQITHGTRSQKPVLVALLEQNACLVLP